MSKIHQLFLYAVPNPKAQCGYLFFVDPRPPEEVESMLSKLSTAFEVCAFRDADVIASVGRIDPKILQLLAFGYGLGFATGHEIQWHAAKVLVLVESGGDLVLSQEPLFDLYQELRKNEESHLFLMIRMRGELHARNGFQPLSEQREQGKLVLAQVD